VTLIDHEAGTDRTAVADLGLDSGDTADRNFEVELIDRILELSGAVPM